MSLDKVRIDKWLWSVRIFKTRTLATESCKTGKVKVEGTNVKPSYSLQRGETIHVKKEGFDMTYKVVELIEKRVGAPIAVTCYEDLTPPEELDKYKSWYIGKSGAETRARGEGRPTKRDRRKLDRFKDG